MIYLTGLGLVSLGFVLVGLQLLHMMPDKINKKLYKIHVITSCITFVLGVAICVVTTEQEGIPFLIYTVVMIGCAVIVCASQRYSYINALKSQEARDRLDELLK